ncbi:hypothetical protein [Flectobacillus rivi]|uniref:Uncharacterized protein n=1 Tax=Flectobacillus rivi TaxID=2984209 RepID=A0ABT6Z0I3_9BACT|nr:hypothetical protein [Flectobacillus rivi]MDI9874635.1 hypothetical protein [Flectobacillus rivi]
MTVSYVVDGKTYTYELDDSAVLNSINLDSLDLSNIRFIDWNTGFDNPISMPQGFGDGSAGGFDLHYQNTLNAMSYLGNISKATSKEDFDRWYDKFKETVGNELNYEFRVLEMMVERFNADYGSITPEISSKIAQVQVVAIEVKNLLILFPSMVKIVATLSTIISSLTIVGAIIGGLEMISTVVLQSEKPKREQAILKQAEKVQNLIEAYKSDALYNALNRFETKVPKSTTASNQYSDIFLIAVFVAIVLIIYKLFNR